MKLSPAEALHFAREMRSVRANALTDAEGWQELVYIFERLVKFLTKCQRTTLGDLSAKTALRNIIQSGQGNACSDEPSHDLLIQQVIKGRNSEFHGGAAARRFVRHCVELSFLLEYGLRNFMQTGNPRKVLELRSVMSSPVFELQNWQMLAEARRLMLENSFTWIPFLHDGTWKALSDHALIRFLNGNHDSLQKVTLKEVLSEQYHLRVHTLEIFPEDTPTNEMGLVEALAYAPVLVSSENKSPERIVGIVTAFDLL